MCQSIPRVRVLSRENLHTRHGGSNAIIKVSRKFFDIWTVFVALFIYDISNGLASSHASLSAKVMHNTEKKDLPQFESRELPWDNDDVYRGNSSEHHLSSSSTEDPKGFSEMKNSFDNFTETRSPGEHRRSKRAVTHLFNMIVCATGCNPLVYKGYGCYCGFLGAGSAMDPIDRCCKMHDWCYDATDCPMFVGYFVPYYWKCYRGYKPVCAVEHGNWGSSGSCAQRLCECDRTFAECLRRYPCPTHKALCTSSPWRFIQNLFMIL